MSKTAGKRETRHKTTARADQLRPLNVPRPVKVELDVAGLPTAVSDFYNPAAQPLSRAVSNEEKAETSKSNVVEKAVESIIEIWHVDDEWWREPISRRCVEVILEGGKHVVLYEDLTSNSWFMQKP